MSPLPAGRRAAPLDRALRRALQSALGGEHQAVYGYGVVGAVLGDDARPEVSAALAAHRARRDRLRTVLADHGVRPVASAAAYDLAEPVTGDASARRLAIGLEEAAASFYADIVMLAQGEVLRLAASELAESSVRAARWRGNAVPFPGLPERSR